MKSILGNTKRCRLLHAVYMLILPKCNKVTKNAVVQTFCCSSGHSGSHLHECHELAERKVAYIGPKQELLVVLLSKVITSLSTLFVLYLPLLLVSSTGMHWFTSSGSRKSLFKTSMTCILRRLTRSTSFNFFSRFFTISLLDWLVKIVI